jgi:hypothetical protein
MFTEFFEFFTHPLGLLVLAFFAVGFVFTRGRGGAVVGGAVVAGKSEHDPFDAAPFEPVRPGRLELSLPESDEI